MFQDARRIVVAKHKQVVPFARARDGSWPAELAAAVLGPSGNLRAPTLRCGSTFVVGFDEGAYAAELGG